SKRMLAVDNHKKWVEAAKFLGCDSIRVNANGIGSREAVATAAIKGLSLLADYAIDYNINVIVENHGGFSSDGKWLVNVIETTERDNIGTLPDFGNFCIRSKPAELTDWGSSVGGCAEEYDKYLGVKEMMPYARSVSAKTNNFDSNGNSVETDYYKMLKIIKDFGYKGYISIEYEGEEYSEHEGILLTKQLLEKAGRNV
ncbi:MAG: TIM barrel protein, partial [SAR202 cluster bacterium]|nr:TIM barrel protein [SAR202 cluster bacterium]